jgi:hypothetical protein
MSRSKRSVVTKKILLAMLGVLVITQGMAEFPFEEEGRDKCNVWKG